MSDFWYNPLSTSTLHVCEQRSLWRDCADAPEPSLVAYVISTIISQAASYGFLTEHFMVFLWGIIWAASSEFGTYRLCKQRRFRRACESAQSRQNLRCSLIQAVSQEEPSDRKPDPWPLWMAGHAQLKFVMTECPKTQIRLTGLIWSCLLFALISLIKFQELGIVACAKLFLFHWHKTISRNANWLQIEIKWINEWISWSNEGNVFCFQTQSDYSETSSVSESRHLFADDSSDNKGQSNVPMTSFNFINSIIGSGIIGKFCIYNWATSWENLPLGYAARLDAI